MIWQWLNYDHTLEAAVEEVLSGRVQPLLLPHKRLTEETLCPHPGSFNAARHRVPGKLVEQVTDRLGGDLLARVPDVLPQLGKPVFVLDGSTLNLAHTKKLLEVYDPPSNQYGPCHWPQMRIVVAHELLSGLALRPSWGPLTSSEQDLACDVMQRLPEDAVQLLDRNFGTLYYVYQARVRKHDVLVRLNTHMARALRQGNLPSNEDQWIEWRPSSYDRRRHPDLPAEAVVRGRWISCSIHRGQRVLQLYLFTTLDLPVKDIIEIYGYRWNIETDLRYLKQTLNMNALTGKDPQIIEKELLSAVSAYNMVRATIYAAAKLAGVEPRRLSFSHVRKIVLAHVPGLLGGSRSYEEQLEMILQRAARCLLPDRRGRDPYPRKVWHRGSTFPKRKK